MKQLLHDASICESNYRYFSVYITGTDSDYFSEDFLIAADQCSIKKL